MSVLKHSHKNGDLGYGENATRNGGASVYNGGVHDSPTVERQIEARNKRKELLGQFAKPIHDDLPSPVKPNEAPLVTGRYTEDGRLMVSLNLPEQPAAEPAAELEATQETATDKFGRLVGEFSRSVNRLEHSSCTLNAALDRLAHTVERLMQAVAQPKPATAKQTKAAAKRRGRPRKQQ